MYYFLVIVCLAQLCSGQNYNESTDALTEENEFNEIPINWNEIKDFSDPPVHQWKTVDWPTRNLPADAVLGGMDTPICGKVYVGRAMYNGNVLPAKICGNDGRAFVAYGGSEVMLNHAEILCTKHAIWKPIKETRIPKAALAVGNTEDGEALYVGRWFVDFRLTPGKIEAGSKILQMTWNGRIHRSTEYEILVLKSDFDL